MSVRTYVVLMCCTLPFPVQSSVVVKAFFVFSVCL